jgi:hypothetical protein
MPVGMPNVPKLGVSSVHAERGLAGYRGLARRACFEGSQKARISSTPKAVIVTSAKLLEVGSSERGSEVAWSQPWWMQTAARLAARQIADAMKYTALIVYSNLLGITSVLH